MPKVLTLIVPHIAPALAQAIADRKSLWPHLARLAGRGSVELATLAPHSRDIGLSPWQDALLDALGLRERAAQYPSAAVTRTGDQDERAEGYWLHAEPMHFSAGLDHLVAITLAGPGTMTRAERAELEPLIETHLQAAGLAVFDTADDWLVRSDRPLELQTASPEAATTMPLDEIMPRGRDAGALRRTMTELQMLLHEHPVNVRRQARGLPEINAIWFHGTGMLSDVEKKSLPDAFGTHPYLRGIYRLQEKQVQPAPDTPALLARMKGNAVIVADAVDLDVLEAVWLAPLSRALALGAVSKLVLLLDRWRLEVSRAASFRFWRSARAPAAWPA